MALKLCSTERVPVTFDIIMPPAEKLHFSKTLVHDFDTIAKVLTVFKSCTSRVKLYCALYGVNKESEVMYPSR